MGNPEFLEHTVHASELLHTSWGLAGLSWFIPWFPPAFFKTSNISNWTGGFLGKNSSIQISWGDQPPPVWHPQPPQPPLEVFAAPRTLYAAKDVRSEDPSHRARPKHPLPRCFFWTMGHAINGLGNMYMYTYIYEYLFTNILYIMYTYINIYIKIYGCFRK